MIIDTSDISLGEHTLILESFDEASGGVESTLKTDTITVNVVKPSLAYFAENLAIQIITSGEKVEWYLPEIIEGEPALEGVTVLPDSLLANYITFDQSTRKVSYDGMLIQGVSSGSKFVKLSITLADSAGSQ